MDVFTTGADGFLEITKDPRAELVYTLDLEPYIGAEALSAAVWSLVTTGGVSIVSQSISGKKSTVRLAGGADARTYLLQIVWTFGTDARVDARDVRVIVKRR